MFQADGPGQFQFSRTIAVGSGPSAIVAGDFTGDGVLDLAVAEANSDDVSVLLNNGHGTFGAPDVYAVGQIPLALVAADFGNGHVDLATANEDSDDVSVLLGNGDGTFQPQLRFGVGTSPAALVAADFNGDDRLDLAVANRGSGDISVLLGRGDGTFQDQVTNPVASDPTAAVTADLTHDGHVDIITANSYSNDISVLLGNGDGTFQAAQSFPAGRDPTDLVVGDFNGDGRLDVAVADSGNIGVGTRASPSCWATATARLSPDVLSDRDVPVVDRGGRLHRERHARSGRHQSRFRRCLDPAGNGLGGFQPLQTISLGDEPGQPMSITAGDFTGDGLLDLAVTYQDSGEVSILAGDGRGDFQPLTHRSRSITRPVPLLRLPRVTSPATARTSWPW